MSHFLFTSESVSAGHPDKIADQISDATLDACLAGDPYSRVACEVMVTAGLVIVTGEITTAAEVNYQDIVRNTIRKIGYDSAEAGFDYRSCGILQSIGNQSPDIALGVDETAHRQMGAGDQGIMFGYACDETPELMPMPIMIAHRLIRELDTRRTNGRLPYLRPDAKSQVTIEYDAAHKPARLHTVVLSTQHAEGISQDALVRDIKQMIKEIVDPKFIDDDTLFYINPTGRFVIGGPESDCGLTGRKIIVDTYGGMARHGGGCFSGKDPTKVDRSASYAARYVAKNIVAAGLAKRCEVQVSYAIGVAHPISIFVDTFGTSTVNEELLGFAIPDVFDLTPKGMIQMLDLRRPIYLLTASGGHFGRTEPEFTWEKTDKVEALLQSVKQKSFLIKDKGT